MLPAARRREASRNSDQPYEPGERAQDERELMPEGDSIFRVATTLRPLLVGTPLVRVVTAGVVRDELAGASATAITPFGKHMTIALDRGWEIRVHLGMNGRWRRYRAPRTAPDGASLVLVTSTDQFACLNARDIELTVRRDPRRGRALAALGPDILADDFDPAVAAARARARDAAPIGEVVLDQRVAAGIGNIYKSEALWAEQQSPLTRVRDLSDDKLVAIYARARSLMKANLGRGPRRTTRSPAQRYHAYRNVGRPCPRCRTPIKAVLQGEQLRRTYYCPGCQR
jgi:endonuclease-8